MSLKALDRREPRTANRRTTNRGPRHNNAMRVIVIGAGIGGLTAAIALRRKGIEVEIFERAAELTDVGAGISLWPNALKALYQLGMRPALDALSFVSAEGALRTASGAVLTRTAAHEFVARLGLPVMVFHRAELLNVLMAAARDIPIHRAHECHLHPAGCDPRHGPVRQRCAG